MASKKTEEQAFMWLNRFIGGDDILDSINAKAVRDLIRDQKAEINRMGKVINALKYRHNALLTERTLSKWNGDHDGDDVLLFPEMER